MGCITGVNDVGVVEGGGIVASCIKVVEQGTAEPEETDDREEGAVAVEVTRGQ